MSIVTVTARTFGLGPLVLGSWSVHLCSRRPWSIGPSHDDSDCRPSDKGRTKDQEPRTRDLFGRPGLLPVPVENLRTAPRHHARPLQDRLNRAFEMPDAMG